MSPKAALVALSLVALTGCLTISQSQHDQVAIHAAPQRKMANVDFFLERVNWQGTRILFTKEQSENTKTELITVLHEFGIEATDKPSALRIEAHLRIKDTSCETLFIDSNCWLMLFTGTVSLYLIPTSFGLDHEVTLKIQDGNKVATEMKNSVGTKTYFHLILAPLLPIEIWRLVNPEFRLNLYRELLNKAIERHSDASGPAGEVFEIRLSS